MKGEGSMGNDGTYMSNAKRLRTLLAGDQAVLFAGTYDAFSAMIAERAGFEAVFMSGYSVSAAVNGKPDWSFAGMGDFLGTARNIVNAVDIPLLCDVDQGFGPVTNLMYTIQSFQRAGVAAVHVEDQVFPKQSCYEDGRELYPIEEATNRIRAAASAVEDPDFILIARCEASRIEGPDAALARMESYLNAGADYVIPADYDPDVLARYCQELPGKVFAYSGYTDAEDLDALGVKAIVDSASALRVAYNAMDTMYRELKAERRLSSHFYRTHAAPKGTAEIDELLGQPRWEQVRNQFDPAGAHQPA